MKTPAIVLKTDRPIDGYWNGGAKQTFVFTPEFDTPIVLGKFNGDGSFTPDTRTGKEQRTTFVPNGTIKWGSWGANFWFTCGAGKSWNAAIAYAKGRLAKVYHGQVGYTLAVEWGE